MHDFNVNFCIYDVFTEDLMNWVDGKMSFFLTIDETRNYSELLSPMRHHSISVVNPYKANAQQLILCITGDD